jgi:hypothetical protein
LSGVVRHTGGMNNRILRFMTGQTESLITTFGQARLVGLADGSVELRGGRPADHTAAKEWISLFMHEAVPRRAK